MLLVYRKQLFDLLVAVQKTEPADLYAGDDRDDLVKALVLAGIKSDLDSIRIPEKTWKRRTYWQLSGGQWQAIDRSVLEAYLFAKVADNSSPSWQRFLLTRDYLNKDAISVQRDEWFLR